MARATRTGTPYQTRLDPPPSDPAAAHPWDEAYLGPYQEPSTWWQPETATPAMADTVSDPMVQEASTPFALQAPETKPKTAKQRAAVTQTDMGPQVLPAPDGTYQERLKRVMALSQPSTETDIRELTAFLADENANIRWLAGATLGQHGSPLVIRALHDFLDAAEPEHLAIAQESITNTARLIADASDNETVQAEAQAVLQRLPQHMG